ncbi:MAG: YgfZ/GcvT domain-containing protein [Sandaracinobacter sp.]
MNNRAVLRLSGPESRAFLQGLLTQDVTLLAEGQPLYAGLLSPQGKVLFQLFLFADGADVLIDVEAAQIAALARRLTMFRLRRQVVIAPEPWLAVWQQWGEPSPHPADPRHRQAGSRFLGPPGGESAGLAEWHAHRLPLGLPQADEIGSDDLLWLETNARELNGVSFTKGCYTGQENTARMHHRDKLRKRLLAVRLPVGADGPILCEGKPAADLRGARHGDLQMALVRMEFADRPLEIGGVAVELLSPEWLPAD